MILWVLKNFKINPESSGKIEADNDIDREKKDNNMLLLPTAKWGFQLVKYKKSGGHPAKKREAGFPLQEQMNL